MRIQRYGEFKKGLEANSSSVNESKDEKFLTNYLDDIDGIIDSLEIVVDTTMSDKHSGDAIKEARQAISDAKKLKSAVQAVIKALEPKGK